MQPTMYENAFSRERERARWGLPWFWQACSYFVDFSSQRNIFSGSQLTEGVSYTRDTPHCTRAAFRPWNTHSLTHPHSHSLFPCFSHVCTMLRLSFIHSINLYTRQTGYELFNSPSFSQFSAISHSSDEPNDYDYKLRRRRTTTTCNFRSDHRLLYYFGIYRYLFYIIQSIGRWHTRKLFSILMAKNIFTQHLLQKKSNLSSFTFVDSQRFVIGADKWLETEVINFIFINNRKHSMLIQKLAMSMRWTLTWIRTSDPLGKDPFLHE